MPRHLSQKHEGRAIRIGDQIKSLPTDLHTALSEAKARHGYETLWGAAQQAIRLGLIVMQIQHNRSMEIINNGGIISNNAQQRGL